jgi:uncharacterized protein YjgD (DUF1641 family)
MDNEITLLHEKIDYLTEQLEAQQRHRDAMDELKQDLIPITNHMVKLTVNELEEIGTDFELEDLLFLLKRFLRNTRLWMDLMDRLEAIMDLTDEASILGNQAVANVIETLDQLDRAGYFAFARGAYSILERIVSEVSEEELRTLGERVPAILTTVQNITQPEMLDLADRAVASMQEAAPENGKPPSILSLTRQLFDPKVRSGLSKTLTLVSSLAEEPAGEID